MISARDHLADVRAFMKSMVILIAAEVDLFTYLDDHPSTAEDRINPPAGALFAINMLINTPVAIRTHFMRFAMPLFQPGSLQLPIFSVVIG